MTVESREHARARLAPFVERARSFSGWLPRVQSRQLDAPPPWDYETRARELTVGASSVVDLGTGGGERYAVICNGFAGRAVATEEWSVNAVVAKDKLQPLGIGVVRCNSLRLPFDDECFDLVLDRHEELSPAEVSRVLIPDGTVLTQQVVPDDWKALGRYFPRRTDFGDHFNLYQKGFRDAGLQIIDTRLYEYRTAYTTLGDFVYLLCIAPWTIPEFDPLGVDLDALLAFERDLTTPDGLVLTEGRYIIEAHKP